MKRIKIVAILGVLVIGATAALVLVRTRDHAQTAAQENFDTLYQRSVEEQARAAAFIAEQARLVQSLQTPAGNP